MVWLLSAMTMTVVVVSYNFIFPGRFTFSPIWDLTKTTSSTSISGLGSSLQAGIVAVSSVKLSSSPAGRQNEIMQPSSSFYNTAAFSVLDVSVTNRIYKHSIIGIFPFSVLVFLNWKIYFSIKRLKASLRSDAARRTSDVGR